MIEILNKTNDKKVNKYNIISITYMINKNKKIIIFKLF